MIKIRLANISDLKELNELITMSARELSRDIYTEQETEGAIKYVFGVDTELVDDKTYFVIEKNGEIAGCGGWSKRKTLFGGNQFSGREESDYLDPSKDAAKIRAFFVHPKFARLGLGSMLLKYCEQQANSNGFTQLEMMATLPGVKLYSAMAYKAISDEIVMLPNKVPLRFVRMAKNLKELIPGDKVSGELLSNATIVFFRKHEALSDQTKSLGMESRAKL
ncbi:MAG: GNAT family N-acetyltransferase [Legionella sp.]